MYCLVFWIESKKWSIEPLPKIPKGTKKGDEIEMNHGGDDYAVRILQFSEDKKFLESIEVDVNGDMLPSKKEKRKKMEQSEKDQKKIAKKMREKLRRESMEGINEQLLERNNDMDATDPPESPPEVSHSLPGSSKKHSSFRKLKVSLHRHDSDQNKSNATSIRTSPALPRSSTSKDSPISSRSVSPIPQPRAGPKPGEKEIKPGSNVIVDQADLRLMLKFRHRPTELMRRLMLYLVGAEKLRCLTARGQQSKPSYKGKELQVRDGVIDPVILDAVKHYVDRKGLYKMDSPTFIMVINRQIDNLRRSQAKKQRLQIPIPSDDSSSSSDDA